MPTWLITYRSIGLGHALAQAEARFGAVDVLVNNAGHGYRAAAAEAAAEVIVKAVEDPAPPHLLLLGSDAIEVASDTLDADRATLKAWKATNLTIDFPN